MAITKVDQEPLIEKIIEDDYLENIQSQLNNYNDAKSSYFSNEEIDLKKINNIYTSHCFLMKNNNESVHAIWEKFDRLENKSIYEEPRSQMNVAAKPFFQTTSEQKNQELNEKNLFLFNQQ
jgi:hypothetical protein